MPLVETDSLVLKSHNLAEADRIVVLFTRDHGVVRGVAKGIKRLNSKFGSSFEPFNTIRVAYFQKEERELVSIQNAELIRSNFAAASDPDTLNSFSYIADLLLSFSPPNDPNELLFRMVRACFESSELSKESLPAMQFYFEVWLLRLGGVLPDWEKCYSCSRIFDASDRPAVDSAQHFICENCHQGRLIDRVPDGWMIALQNVRKLGPADFAAGADNIAAAVLLSPITRRIIERVLDRPMHAIRGAAIQFTG